MRLQERFRKLDQRQMEVIRRRVVEHLLRACGDCPGGLAGGRPEHDVQFRRKDREEPGVRVQASKEVEGGLTAHGEVPGEGPLRHERQQFMRCPEGHGRGAGARALEADLPEVQVRRGEIGIGRVVLVMGADGGVSEQDAAAAIGLQAVFVRIDDDGIRRADGVEGGPGLRRQIVRQREIAAIGRIDMDAAAVPAGQRQYLGKGIGGADARRPERGDHGADVSGCQHPGQRRHVHPAEGVARHGRKAALQDLADPAVGVMGLIGGDDQLVGGEPARDPERFHIRHCAAARQMAEMFAPADHGGDPRHGLALHQRAGAAAVHRVIVRVDELRQRVGEAGDRVRRLQHLSGIERMLIGVVVPHPLRRRHQDRPQRVEIDGRLERGKIVETGLQASERFAQELERCPLETHAGETELRESPPSTTSEAPVMYFASSDARKSAACATSQASPI